MLFTSDNWSGVHPKIMDAMVTANTGNVPAYGSDDLTKSVHSRFSDMFGAPVEPAFVATGSAANSLALACLTVPWGAVLCHKDAHIHVDEAGAPEFFTAGVKIVPLEGDHGKITVAALDEAMAFFTPPQTHRVIPQVLSLTQGTEAGTIYTPNELSILIEKARNYGLKVHMDGARFANACASLDVDPKAITTDVGVDVLTLGGTKNGCMVAEAIVFFDQDLGAQLVHRQKRAGQGFSKNRFLAAQWNAYFEDDLWLTLAGHANDQASKLSKLVAKQPDCHLIHPSEINEVFVEMSDKKAEHLREKGAAFYDWVQPGDPYSGKLRRLVTSFTTTDEQIERFAVALNG